MNYKDKEYKYNRRTGKLEYIEVERRGMPTWVKLIFFIIFAGIMTGGAISARVVFPPG